jgi:predicted signal transduction protein with EAL and GGDEF domain
VSRTRKSGGGVETPAAAVTLMQYGCYRAQGYLLSRPVVSDAMESFLSSRWLPMPFLADGEAWLRQYSSEPTRDIVRCTFS